jgi:PBP1b-binding outer membrane lipoprotein LpoB
MRRILTLSALLAVAAFWTGCSADNATRPNTATTNSAAPATGNTSNANSSAMNTSSSTTAPKTVGGSAPPSGIKPPMKDEKAKK